MLWKVTLILKIQSSDTFFFPECKILYELHHLLLCRRCSLYRQQWKVDIQIFWDFFCIKEKSLPHSNDYFLKLKFSSHRRMFSVCLKGYNLCCLDKLITELGVIVPVITYFCRGFLVQIMAQGQSMQPLRQVKFKDILVLFASTFLSQCLRKKPSRLTLFSAYGQLYFVSLSLVFEPAILRLSSKYRSFTTPCFLTFWDTAP